MKLFARLFSKTPPSPPTLQERIDILNAGSADLVLDAALRGAEEGLRVAAIRQLPDGEAVRRLAGLFDGTDKTSAGCPAAVERAAQARIAQLIDEGTIDFSAFCEQAQNRPALFAVAALCNDRARLPHALASIRDPGQIARLVVESPSSRLRQSAAEFVHDPVQLRQLLLQVRNKDKNVYKIIKQKCDALNAEERKAEEIKSEIAALCELLERHSHKTYDSLYPSAFAHLHNRWNSLGTPPGADTEQRARQAIDRCGEVIEEHARQLAQRAAEEAAQQAARELRAREHKAAETAASTQAEVEARLREEAAAIRAAEESARAEQQAAEEQLFRQIGGLIRMANAALRDGGTQRAGGLRRSIDEKLAVAISPPPYLSRQIQQLDEKLNELKQWKDYAVAPKRLELIAEMASLIGSTQEPKALADQIKTLQQEWRTISKGIVSEAPGEWERFQQASQAAYQPCREYFEEQARLRQQNLDNRKLVLKRLLGFEATQDAENPDWRLLASVLAEAPQEWRRYFPVEREVGRAVQEEFDVVMGRLHAKLDAWYERNVADKQSLVKRARHLLTQEDSREAIDAVKRLQLLWKETGPAPSAQSQSLWNEFREVCDSVYQKRQQAFAEYNLGLEANKLKAVALCEELEQVAASSGSTLLEAAVKMAEWRAAFDALDEMPRTEARGLQDRFERALELCKAAMARQKVRDAEQSFTNLFTAARCVQAYEWAVLRETEPSDRESLQRAAESFIESVQQWPKGGLKAIKAMLINAATSADVDLGAREKALRTLCVRGEIHGETSTPVEDEALRREYQVQRLLQGMGGGISADEGEWDEMALEWIRVGAVEPGVYETLRQRFLRCWEKRPVGSPQPSSLPVDGGAETRKFEDGRGGQARRHGRDGSRAANRR
jgi:Domain of Unknown Function (DUF349)